MTMRYRKLDANGDYSFGNGQADFFRDDPAAVGQAVLTRLLLFSGEWFLNTADGTKWFTEVLGPHTQNTRDMEIKARVLGTPNVNAIVKFSSGYTGTTRAYSVTMTLDTAFGETEISGVVLPPV